MDRKRPFQTESSFLKVAIVHIRLTNKGGLETRLYNYVNYFLKKNSEVEVISSKIDPNIQLDPRIKVIKIDLSKWPRVFRPILFNNSVSRILKQNSYDFSLGLERTSAPKFLIAPNTHAAYIKHNKKRVKSLSDRIQLHMDKLSFHSAERIFACSEMVKQEIIDYYKIRKEKIEVLYPPLDVSKFNSAGGSKESCRKKLGIDLNKKVFLLVSTSHKRKGLHLLQKVFKNLSSEYQLIVAGSECSETENIRCAGFIHDLPDYYKAADFTLHPAIYEPFGQIISESLACGTPAFVSNRVGAKELISGTNGRIVDSLEADVWENEIRKANPDDYFIDASDLEKYSLSLEKHMEKMLSRLKS